MPQDWPISGHRDPQDLVASDRRQRGAHEDARAGDLLAQKEIREEVKLRIAQLPEAYRVVLMLRDIEGLSTKEVAASLDLGEGTVKVRLHRARAALKKLLEPFWRESGA